MSSINDYDLNQGSDDRYDENQGSDPSNAAQRPYGDRVSVPDTTRPAVSHGFQGAQGMNQSGPGGEFAATTLGGSGSFDPNANYGAPTQGSYGAPAQGGFGGPGQGGYERSPAGYSDTQHFRGQRGGVDSGTPDFGTGVSGPGGRRDHDSEDFADPKFNQSFNQGGIDSSPNVDYSQNRSGSNLNQPQPGTTASDTSQFASSTGTRDKSLLDQVKDIRSDIENTGSGRRDKKV